MANSIYVPLRQMPVSLEQLKTWLLETVLLLDRKDIRIDVYKNNEEASFLDSSLIVEGGAPGLQCLLSIFPCSEEISECDGYLQIADIKTRGNWWFAGMVAYALLINSGCIVFNDAGELDGQATYTADSLRLVLEKKK